MGPGPDPWPVFPGPGPDPWPVFPIPVFPIPGFAGRIRGGEGLAPPPQHKIRKPEKWLKRKRCAAFVRVEWWPFQIHSSDDDLIGGETKSLYLGRNNWYPGRKNWYPGRKHWYPGRQNSYPGRQNWYSGRKNWSPGRKTDIQEEELPHLQPELVADVSWPKDPASGLPFARSAVCLYSLRTWAKNI